jgi:hypothetical protein
MVVGFAGAWRTVVLLLLGTMMIGGCGEFKSAGRGYDAQLWICPPMHRSADQLFAEDANWSKARAGTDVFKFYGRFFERSDPQLIEQIAKQFNEAGIAIAIEYAPLRSQPEDLKIEVDCAAEFGANVDYVEMDNPIGVLLDAGKFGNTGIIRDMERPATPQEAAEELIAWLKKAQEIMPNVRKWGLIECVWRYPIGPYPGSIPEDTFKDNLPPHQQDLRDVLDVVLAEAKKQGVRIDYFHGEHGRLGVRQLAEGYHVDVWSKIKLLEEYCHSRGLEFGILYADESTASWWPDRVTENEDQVTVQNMYNAVFQHLQNGGNPDHIVIQNWGRHPIVLVPEDQQYTYTWLVKEVVSRLEKSR